MKGWTNPLLATRQADFVNRVRRESVVGRPLGDDGFVRRLEKRLDRTLARGKMGRPKKRRGQK